MLDIVKNAIGKFYFEKDHLTFERLCSQQLPLFDELKEQIAPNALRLSEDRDCEDSPSRTWYIHLYCYKRCEFEIKYTTKLKISKVAPIFNIQHEFDVEHKNKDLIDPELGYYGDKPYTKQQVELHNEISKILIQKGYIELKQFDLDEVVEGFQMPHGVTIFGKNITVELLLFRDVLCLCDRASMQKRN